ncbi:MAG: hypothetical protein LBF91_07120 [Azoarcus sp.]|nr:hypothetical protein [Azoarcus sp.]
MLISLADVLPGYLKDGKSIRPGDLGVFRISVSSEGAVSEAEPDQPLLGVRFDAASPVCMQRARNVPDCLCVQRARSAPHCHSARSRGIQTARGFRDFARNDRGCA